MDSVVGIDLSGLTSGARGRTVVAEIALGPIRLVPPIRTIRRGPRGDVELLDWIIDRRPRGVAIDAPLGLPHGVTCRDEACERCRPGRVTYLERDVDREVRRLTGGGMPTVMLAAIAFRGIYLASRLRSEGIDVIEVYPAAAYWALGLREASYQERAAFLSALVGAFDWSLEDEVDAVCAALVAADYTAGKRNAIERVDGTIWLPYRGVPVPA